MSSLFSGPIYKCLERKEKGKRISSNVFGTLLSSIWIHKYSPKGIEVH